MIFRLMCVAFIAASTAAFAQSNTIAKYAAAPPPLAITLRTGFLSQIPSSKIVFDKIQTEMSVGYFAAVSDEFNCTQNPAVAIYDCGADHSCANGTLVASVTLTASGTLASETPSGAVIAGGDYYAWNISGQCTALDINAKAALSGP
ncbi:MAG: hypothetical protein WDN02_05175 [Methylovirgula sp.]|uniref:hypothetical protein n=1 Tax=Methylovirgula sp. TaxID=1978224 RepID=UPI0030761D78